MPANKPNWFLNVLCFAAVFAGTLATFGYLAIPVFIVAGCAFLLANSKRIKSAAASSLMAILALLVGSLVSAYFSLLR